MSKDKEIIERQPVEEVKFTTALRKSGVDGEYVNLYIVLDGYKFELVPHCRTKKETAFFYALLSRSPLALNK